ITAGPDRKLWFAEANASSIGAIAVDGTATEYRLRASAGLTEITSGPDGNLWFTETDADKVGRISPTSGAIVEYVLPNLHSEPRGITTGSDGALWFAEFGSDQIGRLSTAGELTEFAV